MKKSVYGVPLKDIYGQEIRLESFTGRKLLIVNVASYCGYTRQYQQLEELYRYYKDKIMVIGCPCNDFGSQEPGNPEEIIAFCSEKFAVTFLLSEKLKIVQEPHPLFYFLCKKDENGVMDTSVNWNFTKFLLDESGYLIQSFPSSVEPLGEALIDRL